MVAARHYKPRACRALALSKAGKIAVGVLSRSLPGRLTAGRTLQEMVGVAHPTNVQS